MAQSIRQTELFTAEDWTVIYRAFSEVNFNAYDFDTIREAMIRYVRINFAEDFNDWIESSEFVAIVDLLAYLGQSLAFRMDLNSRENFIDSAERRESILRLARLISYNPRRNLPGTGLLKITQVVTDETLYDSNGINLANYPVRWNDANDPDWLERFILILNAAFIKTNPYGRPISNGKIGGITTQLYQFNNSIINLGVFPFTAVAAGETLDFEIVNPDFVDGETFFERSPNPFTKLNLIYRNDGLGNQSTDTGFFFLFKQGSLSREDFQINLPVENRLIDLNNDNVNDTDVWVQEIADNGAIIQEWTQVPALMGSNVIYNSLNKKIRNIFSVVTRERDRISLRFADGRFGTVPVGLIRVWFRQSAGTSYDLRPQDVGAGSTSLSYFDGRNEPHTLTIQYGLNYTVRNSQPRETTEAIKRRAPQLYYTQNRMVNGEDYNVFPLSTNRAIKLKAVNRTYSGHSRFIDLNDPTGSYQNTNVFADDGMIYREFENNYEEEPISEIGSSAVDEIIEKRLLPLLRGSELANFYFWYMTSNAREGSDYDFQDGFSNVRPDGQSKESRLKWFPSGNPLYTSTGVFASAASQGGYAVGPTASFPLLRLIGEGATLKFRNSGWANVVSVLGEGTYSSIGTSSVNRAPIVLNQPVVREDVLEYVMPAFRHNITGDEREAIRRQLETQSSFGLRYNFAPRLGQDGAIISGFWEVIPEERLKETGHYSHEVPTTFGDDLSWLIKVIYTPTAWQLTARGLRYIFESKDQVRFFHISRYKAIDLETMQEQRDNIRVLGVNPRPGSAEALALDVRFHLQDSYMYPDGYIEPRRVQVVTIDSDDDGVADYPIAFDMLVFPERLQRPWQVPMETVDGQQYPLIPQPNPLLATGRDGREGLLRRWQYLLFWERYQGHDGYLYRRPLVRDRDVVPYTPDSAFTAGMVGYDAAAGKFYRAGSDGKMAAVDQDNYMVREGRGLEWNRLYDEERGLSFQWKHFAPVDHRIDPAASNIVDMFVLPTQYYTEVLEWLDSHARPLTPMPSLPTPEELRITFSELADYKSISDELVFHPVKFKLLFGSEAAEELRVRFKVIKMPSTTYSDGEIKSRLIQSVNEYFNIQNWDFGESFYFSELAAYIHQQLVTVIASVVVVPLNEEASFGSLFQIKAEPDELFLSTARVTDVQIVDTFTAANLRIA